MNATSRHTIKCVTWTIYKLIKWNWRSNVIVYHAMFHGRSCSLQSRRFNKNSKFQICLIFLNQMITWLPWSHATILKLKNLLKKCWPIHKISTYGDPPKIQSISYSLKSKRAIYISRLTLKWSLVLIWPSITCLKSSLKINNWKILLWRIRLMFLNWKISRTINSG